MKLLLLYEEQKKDEKKKSIKDNIWPKVLQVIRLAVITINEIKIGKNLTPNLGWSTINPGKAVDEIKLKKQEFD